MRVFHRATKYRNLLFAVSFVLAGTILEAGCSRSRPGIGTRVDPLAMLKTTLGMFEVDNGRYPNNLEALLKKPDDPTITNWHGPYLEKASDLKDRWGHEFVYRCPGIHNTNGYDLYSLGPDGRSDTDEEDADDISNWRKKWE